MGSVWYSRQRHVTATCWRFGGNSPIEARSILEQVPARGITDVGFRKWILDIYL